MVMVFKFKTLRAILEYSGASVKFAAIVSNARFMESPLVTVSLLCYLLSINVASTFYFIQINCATVVSV